MIEKPLLLRDATLTPAERDARRKSGFQTIWFLLLVSCICLEGLGRRYLPQVPSIAFYFAKDVVLVFGYLLIKPAASARRAIRFLYRGFAPVWICAFAWTFIEMFNPEHQSLSLALIGIRAYWLWWLAPLLIATVLRNERTKRHALYILVALTVGISALAAAQFASPADSSLNLYSVVDGENLYASDAAIVSETGRARVASTFAFTSGFSDFTMIVPTLLLSLGLEAPTRRLRLVALGATLFAAAVVPMSGSRSSVVLGAMVLAITCWSAGLFFTVAGRRIMIGALVGGILAIVAFPDALLGVQSRFNPEETQERISQNAVVLPPVALLTLDYPFMGIGTGMEQNARASLGVHTQWDAEMEVHRYLIELGPIGFLLVWTVKFGLAVGCWRAYKILKRAGRRAASAAALSFAALGFLGNITFDHVWQALYFMGTGFILAEVMSVMESTSAAKSADAQLPAAPQVKASLGHV